MFKSNAVRNCVELHEIELNRFYDCWVAFCASGLPLPETSDPAYESARHLGGHVLRAARNYLTWIGQCVGRPAGDVDSDNDLVSVAGKGRGYLDAMLSAWRRHLAALEDGAESGPEPRSEPMVTARDRDTEEAPKAPEIPEKSSG